MTEPSLTLCKICGKPTNGMPFHTCVTEPTEPRTVDDYAREIYFHGHDFKSTKAMVERIMTASEKRGMELARNELLKLKVGVSPIGPLHGAGISAGLNWCIETVNTAITQLPEGEGKR